MAELLGYQLVSSQQCWAAATCSSSCIGDEKRKLVSSFCEELDDFEENNQNEHDTTWVSCDANKKSKNKKSKNQKYQSTFAVNN